MEMIGNQQKIIITSQFLSLIRQQCNKNTQTQKQETHKHKTPTDKQRTMDDNKRWEGWHVGGEELTKQNKTN